MTFDSPNPTPRFPAVLSRILTDPARHYVLVDIGARSANHFVYNHLKTFCRIIGFEVDAEECVRLNAHNPSGLAKFYPYAIAGEDGKAPFYITRLDLSCGLRQANQLFWSRFPMRNLDVVREVEVTTTRLDTFVAKERVSHMDFLKIDVEGSELEVLRGATRSLVDQAVLCIQTELWWDPVLKGQSSYAELDTFIRQSGFRFFDLNLSRFPRNSLPIGKLGGEYNQQTRALNLRYDPKSYGQATSGDALYFRDPVGERREGWKSIDWTDDRLLRLCGLLDVFDYGDCAIEILEEFRSQLSVNHDVNAMIDALTPSVQEHVIGYGEYINYSNELRRQYNKVTFGDEGWTPTLSGYEVSKR